MMMPQKPMMSPSGPPPSGPPMGGGGPPGAGGPMPPGAGAEGEGGNPEQIKGQLVILLQKAKEVAEKNGLDWNEVMSEVQGNRVKSDVPLPRSPSAMP